MPQVKDNQAEKIIISYSGFYSIQAFSGLDEAHLHRARQPALLSLIKR